MSALQGFERLDKDSMVPLYRQLARSVEKRIQDGSFPEGSRIPSEQELMRRFGLSRVTVRQAMEDLFQRSIIVRKQGLGTFVQKPMMSQEVDDLFGFYPALLNRGLNPKTRILSYEFLNADREVREKLDLSPGEKVLRFFRQYLLEPSLFLIIQMHIPQRFGRELESEGGGGEKFLPSPPGEGGDSDPELVPRDPGLFGLRQNGGMAEGSEGEPGSGASAVDVFRRKKAGRIRGSVFSRGIL